MAREAGVTCHFFILAFIVAAGNIVSFVHKTAEVLT